MLGGADRQAVWSTNGTCSREKYERASRLAAFNRYHVRLFETVSGSSRYTVGDAHHDKVITGHGCDHVAGLAGHISDSFDSGREEAWHVYPYTTRSLVWWGNTYEITQCDGSKTHSDGYVLFMTDSRVHRAGDSEDFENLSPPTVSGTARPGYVLTVDPGSWVSAPNGYVYEWCRVEVSADDCISYPGASASSWIPAESDVGNRVAVWVRPAGASPEDAVLSTIVEIQPPPPPTVSSDPVSGLQPTQAIFNGRVTPNGGDTHYYFEYGQSPAYGSSIPAPPGQDAGSGFAALPVSVAVSSLLPSTTYHYRLVAANRGGTAYSSDQVFQTLPDQQASNWTARTTSSDPNSQQWAFYRAPNGQLTERYYTGSAWATKELGGQVAPGTTPAVVRLPTENANDSIWVFYRNSAGHLAETYYVGGSWLVKDLNVAMAPETSPSVVRSPSTDPNDRIWVFTNGANGRLAETYYAGTGWANLELGAQMAPGTSPVAVRSPSTDPNDRIWVFTNGANGRLAETYYAGTGWGNLELGAQMAPGTSPSVVRAPTTDPNGFMAVFTNGANGHLAETYYAGTGWANLDLGAQMAPGSSPSAVRAPTTGSNGYMAVFTNGGNGRLAETYFAGTGWANLELAVQMKAATSPSAIRANTTDPNGFMSIFMNGADGHLVEAYYAGGWASLDQGVLMG